MTQDFGCTAAQGKQAHSRLRNYFSRAAVWSKDKSDSGIIEFSFLRSYADNNRDTYPTHSASDYGNSKYARYWVK